MIKSFKNFKYCCCDVSLYEHNRNPSFLKLILSPLRFSYIFFRELFSFLICYLNKNKHISKNCTTVLFAGTLNQLSFAKEYQKYFKNSEIIRFSGVNDLNELNINFFVPLVLINKWLFKWLYWGVFKENKLRKAIFCNPEKFAIAQSEIEFNKYLGCKLVIVFSSYSVQSKKIIDYFKSKNIDTLFIPHALIPKKNPVIETKFTLLTNHQIRSNNCLRNTKIICSNISPFMNNVNNLCSKRSILMCINNCDNLIILFKYFLIIYKTAKEYGYQLIVRFHPSMRIKYLFKYMNWFNSTLKFSRSSLINDLMTSFVVVTGLSNVIIDAKNNNTAILLMSTFDENLRRLHEPSLFDGCGDLSLNFIEAKQTIKMIYHESSISPHERGAKTSHPIEFLKFINNYD